MIDSQRRPWTFLTSHARVLILISQNPDIRVPDLAEMAGITDRSAQRIIVELEDDGYPTREKIGRRNRYMLSTDATLRHPLEQSVEIRFMLDVFRVDADHKSSTVRELGPFCIVPTLVTEERRDARFGRTARTGTDTRSDAS
jgi:hypothetical protein